MRLPGLPASKPSIIERAKKEGWPFEEKTGIGGTRRVYQVPDKYLSTKTQRSTASGLPRNEAAVDWGKMGIAMRALDEWEQERGVKVMGERRIAVISVLYDYVVRGEESELARVFKAIG